MTRHPLPLLLLTALILLPVAVLTVAGLVLLDHERERWEDQAEAATERWLDQSADEVRIGLGNLKKEVEMELRNALAGDRVEALRELQSSHPLVRNTFLVTASGDRLLPPEGVRIDAESERFLRRYDSLFSERSRWFETAPDDAVEETAYLDSSRILESFKGRGRAAASAGEAARSQWRPWQWEDRDALLAYLLDPATGDILGIEVEMAALYARLDALLRSMAATPGQAMALLDRQDAVLVANREVEGRAMEQTVEIGPLLPFARLGLVQPPAASAIDSRAFYVVAVSLCLLLGVSIVAGTLGLTAWVHRSRREALRKTTFVSNVSHEFKTPLTTLRLYSELLLEGRVKDPTKQRAYLSTLRNESERLARLVHNVLDFSRLEMGRARYQPVAVDLSEHIAAVRDRLEDRLRGAGLTVEEPDRSMEVFADPDGIDQILLNLFDNAVKYAKGATCLCIDSRSGDGVLVVEFADDGPGIPASERKNVFKAFHQVDRSLTRENGGTGLGLHICRRIACQMGGDLELVSNRAGACFRWTLPRPPGGTP